MDKPTLECRILAINPYRQTESDGDEIYLKLGKKRIWPNDASFVEVKDQESIKVNYPIRVEKLGDKVELELWEYDNILFSECIGKFDLLVDEVGGPFRTDLNIMDASARYSIVWEVVMVARRKLATVIAKRK